MISPICIVDSHPTDTEVVVPSGKTITIALDNPAGVAAWTLEAISADIKQYPKVKSGQFTESISIDTVAKTASFTMPSEPCAIMFESRVNGGYNADGERDPKLTSRFMVHVSLPKGILLVAVNETNEANAQLGYASKLDALMRSTLPPVPFLRSSNHYLINTDWNDVITVKGDYLHDVSFKLDGQPVEVIEQDYLYAKLKMPQKAAGTYELIAHIDDVASNPLTIEAWHPRQIPGMTDMLDCRKGITLDTNGRVSRWDNQIPASAHRYVQQATEAQRPLQKANGSLTFENNEVLIPVSTFATFGTSSPIHPTTSIFWIGNWTSMKDFPSSAAGSMPYATPITALARAYLGSYGASAGKVSIQPTAYTPLVNGGVALNDGKTKLMGAFQHLQGSTLYNELYAGTARVEAVNAGTTLYTYSNATVGNGHQHMDPWTGELFGVFAVDRYVEESDRIKLNQWAQVSFGAL